MDINKIRIAHHLLLSTTPITQPLWAPPCPIAGSSHAHHPTLLLLLVLASVGRPGQKKKKNTQN
jgi:hypothetical protein